MAKQPGGQRANVEMLRNLADSYGELRDQVNELQHQLAELRKRVLATGASEMIGSRYLVTITPSERNLVDVEKLRKEQPELVDQYSYTIETKVVRAALLGKPQE